MIHELGLLLNPINSHQNFQIQNQPSFHFITLCCLYYWFKFFKDNNKKKKFVPLMSKKAAGVLQKDAPWRAASTGIKPIPKIHHSPLLSIPHNPYSDFALSLIKVITTLSIFISYLYMYLCV